MKSIEIIIQEVEKRYPETPQAAKEAAEYAITELLKSFNNFVEFLKQ